MGGKIEVIVTGRNLCPYGTKEFEGYFGEPFGYFLPAGTYTFSALVDSDDTEYNVSLVYFFNTQVGRGIASATIKRNTRSFVTIEVPDRFNAVYLYSSVGLAQSKGKKATFSDTQLEVGDTANSYDSYKSQSMSIQTPNGLPGIPVESGGNFTDADGQQWVCDEVDFERGVYVQQVGKVIVDGTTLSFEVTPNNLYWNLPGDSAPHTAGNPSLTLITHFPSGVFRFNSGYDFMYTTPGLMSVYFKTIDALNQFCVKENSKGNPLTVYYDYDEPQETPLSDEELAAYAALMSYDGSTVISTDEDVSGISAKVVTDVISKNAWFDPYAELSLYYKALAGFESLDNLPMPHSRESSLVRKLLDSSYELGFSVNENSSRNERYLWDLINGTSTMLTNVPKSDTEKFLHVMIGGVVEEYPVVDTELDYWMDKCVQYMNSNGNIGG